MKIVAGVLGLVGFVLWPNCTSRYNMDMSADEISTRIALSIILFVAAACFLLSVYSEHRRLKGSIEQLKENQKKRRG